MAHSAPLRSWLASLAALAIGAGAQEPARSVVPPAFDLAARAAEHWSWHPLLSAEPPAVTSRAGQPVRNPIDAFILYQLATAGIEPSPQASSTVLLRRLWFDLVGMPPPLEAIERFRSVEFRGVDTGATTLLADAYIAEVDRLLASPQFGERWARHWLDLVRYAETLGHEYDFPLPNAWRYRDYVIRAWNADVPYDQFLREHLAGDLLSEPRRDEQGNNESIQATAAWWFCEQTHSPVDAMQHQADRIDNQIDVLGKAMLGLTVACARCHDHKFDAIAQADYYSLFGFAKSSRYVQAPIQPCDPAGADYTAALAAQRELATVWAEAAEADEPWRPFASSAPERWSASAGTGPLRRTDRTIASADEPAAWIHTNDAFGPAPWRGPWCPAPGSPTLELALLPGAWWHSGIAGVRREGVLQTQTFAIAERFLHVRAAGKSSRLVIVVDGFHVVRDPIYGALHQSCNRAYAHWVTFDVEPWRGHPAFLQCIDQIAPDLGDPDYEKETVYPDDGWLAVQSVIASDSREPPPADPGTDLPPRSWQDTPRAVAAAAERLGRAQAALPVPVTLPALCDGTGSDEPLYVRGNHRTPGALQPRRFLTALAGTAPMAIAHGSGRRQLADAVLAADNPLPARTLVNRLWHHLFGRGLAKSVDNLGALGEPPTHPELLDWLARDFVAHGWSVKHAIRGIVLSATYRQDSRASHGDAVDPGNLLLHRQNVRRLEAEAVRDSLLAISDRLDTTLFGPSVPIPHEDFANARGRPQRSGPQDGEGRRSIYLAIRRNFLPPMLLAYDLPTPFATVGARNVSNVPAQALTMLNDPFVHAMCTLWAEHLLAAHPGDIDGGIRAAYERAFARPVRDDELQRCRDFLTGAAEEHSATLGDPLPWSNLLHCLANTKEFTFRR